MPQLIGISVAKSVLEMKKQVSLKCWYLSAILYSIVLNNELISLYMSGSNSLGAAHELTKWDPDVGLQSVMDSQCLKATFAYIRHSVPLKFGV
jgi:hypothetical protein